MYSRKRYINKIRAFIGFLAMLIGLAGTFGRETVARSLPTFAGAEDYGSHTPGGCGGRIMEVTNLNDSGPGSLRAELEVQRGPRIVVFRVSGTIELSSSINIGKDNSYVTIAGQTAPGDGIKINNRSFCASLIISLLETSQ